MTTSQDFDALGDKAKAMEEAALVQRWAREALSVQDACNLSGVVHRFSEILSEMCKLGWDTPKRNTHPVCQIWVDKLAALTRIQYDQSAVFAAFEKCDRLAKGETDAT